MARIRSVHPEVCRDERLANASATADRTFTRLWCHLDDDGRAIDHPKLLAADLYPLHDDMDADAVERDLKELAGLGLILRYTDGKKRYLSAKPEAWAKYQKPRHPTPSKYPGPQDEGCSPSEDYGPFTAERGNETAERGHPPALDGEGVGGGEVHGGAAADEEDFPTAPSTGKTLSETIAAWCSRRGEPIEKAASNAEDYAEVLRRVEARLGPRDPAFRRMALQVIADYAADVDQPLNPSARKHLARLVANDGALTTLRWMATACSSGAGLSALHSDDPLALTKYMAAIARAERKAS